MTLVKLVTMALPALKAPKIDQEAWSYLEQFDSLAGRNAQASFEQTEWE